MEEDSNVQHISTLSSRSLLLLMLCLPLTLRAQLSKQDQETAKGEQTPVTAGQIPAARSETSSENMAKIVVYRESESKGKAKIKPPVIYDGFLVAYLYNGNYVNCRCPRASISSAQTKKVPGFLLGRRKYADH